jgi:hypothetical protein
MYGIVYLFLFVIFKTLTVTLTWIFNVKL